MKNIILKQGRRFLSFILAVSLLCACAPPDKSPATPSGAGYEQFHAKDLSAQNKFDQFTNDLFREEISDSGISFHFSIADPASRGFDTVPLTL
ncbi:MAG: DUF885 domain-containing protein, partial [Lacrimispora sphenoides]